MIVIIFIIITIIYIYNHFHDYFNGAAAAGDGTSEAVRPQRADVPKLPTRSARFVRTRRFRRISGTFERTLLSIIIKSHKTRVCIHGGCSKISKS